MFRKLVFMFVLMFAASYAFSAGPDISDLPYPGGTGSYWTYMLDDGSEVTLTVTEQRKNIGGRRYKVIEEDVPLWGHLIDRILTSDALPKPFGAERLNPFLISEERGGHIAGYGKEANRFIDGKMKEFARDIDAVLTLKPVATQWVVLKKLERGNTWTVFDLDYSLSFLGDRVNVESSVQGSVISTGVEADTKFGVFDASLIRYVYMMDDGMDALCEMWLTDIGPIQITIDSKVMAELVDYEILPHAQPEPRAVTSDSKLITTWANIKTQ